MAIKSIVEMKAKPGRRDEVLRTLLDRLAEGWSIQDTDLALSCFSPTAVYMEPPDLQLVRGHAQLRTYFSALAPGTFMSWTATWFDVATQTGAGEFVFGEQGETLADHGVTIVQLQDGLISHWREYVRKGPPEQEDFVAIEGKSWKWLGHE